MIPHGIAAQLVPSENPVLCPLGNCDGRHAKVTFPLSVGANSAKNQVAEKRQACRKAGTQSYRSKGPYPMTAGLPGPDEPVASFGAPAPNLLYGYDGLGRFVKVSVLWPGSS